MKLKSLKLAPTLIAVGVIVLVCLVRLVRLDFFEQQEWRALDMRVRVAVQFPAPSATNLGFVFISDDSIAALNNGSLGFRYGLYWPRQIYGRAYRELSAQGARAVAFDVLFPGPRRDHGQVPVSNIQWPEVNPFYAALHPGQAPPTSEDELQKETFTHLESDDYFAWQLHRGGTAILAAEQNVPPLDLFATNAHAVADIGADRDADGVLRRARAFSEYRRWHSAFRQAEAEGYVELNHVRIETNQIVLLRPGESEVAIPIDAETNFDLVDFGGANLPPGVPRKARAFTTERIWHMGIALAARELNLDLAHAEIDLPHGRIVLRGASGVERVIPVDADGYFYINWELTSMDRRLTLEPFEELLAQDNIRTGRAEGALTNHWAGRLVVIGSKATGNDLTDRGATPLEKDTFLVTKHWNVANSVLTGRFIRPASPALQIALIGIIGIITALLSLKMRVVPGLLAVLLLATIYSTLCVGVYVQQRLWLPMILPLTGALFVQYALLITYRALFEQREQRRVKAIFSRVVSPNVAKELLGREHLLLGGVRCELTVLFADIRGFTELTDTAQEQVAEFVRVNRLDSEAAEAAINESARETLDTVNTYLALVADTVKKHDGTLDKYIGDCVMAFWGAPTAQPQHALNCVRAAIDSQRSLHALNQQRERENIEREKENKARISAGLQPKRMLATLSLGTGINTGSVTAGLMGSADHIFNYTVFGREVNLASRLEGVSGRGRIIIGEATHAALLRDDPALAARCVEQEPTKPKGFQKPVRNFEVPWQK